MTTNYTESAENAVKLTAEIIEKHGPRVSGTKSNLSACSDLETILCKYCKSTNRESFWIHPNSLYAIGKIFTVAYSIGLIAIMIDTNDHDVDKIYNLMPDDHIFIDGSGGKQVGKIDMKKGWQDYYQVFPDYSVEITDLIESDSVIGLFGYASGTYKINNDKPNDNFWKTTAAWKAIVENQKIKLWQVYCDYTRLIEIVKNEQT